MPHEPVFAFFDRGFEVSYPCPPQADWRTNPPEADGIGSGGLQLFSDQNFLFPRLCRLTGGASQAILAALAEADSTVAGCRSSH
jgi:hypothetical protein